MLFSCYTMEYGFQLRVSLVGRFSAPWVLIIKINRYYLKKKSAILTTYSVLNKRFALPLKKIV